MQEHHDGRLPVTVVAGTSTALRERLVLDAVRARAAACAVVYDLEPALGGIVLVRRTLDGHGELDREPVPLVGCCLACTVRADVGSALDLVAGADRWAEVLVSVPTSVTPGPVASSLRGHSAARPDTTAVVVDAVLLADQLTGGEMLVRRGLQAAPTDYRSTADLLVGQLEDADVLVLTGLHRLLPDALAHVQALLAHLAPLAVQVPLGADGSGVLAAVTTGRSVDPRSRSERERLAVLAAGLCAPSCGVTTVVWTSDRPLHPGRLRDALEDVVRGVVRSRGHICLAGRPRQRIRWESAGNGLSFGDPVQFHGPPTCELLLTGTGLDAGQLTALLDACTVAPGTSPDADPFAAALGPVGTAEHT